MKVPAWLQWGYPLVLWIVVAAFALFAFSNIVGVAASLSRKAQLHPQEIGKVVDSNWTVSGL